MRKNHAKARARDLYKMFGFDAIEFEDENLKARILHMVEFAIDLEQAAIETMQSAGVDTALKALAVYQSTQDGLKAMQQVIAYKDFEIPTIVFCDPTEEFHFKGFEKPSKIK